MVPMAVRRNIYVALSGLILVGLVSIVGAVSVHAARLTSPSFTIDDTLGGSTAGKQESVNYGLVSSSGESVIGNGQGGSYILAQGYSAQLEQSLQLQVQPSNQLLYYPLDESTGTTAFDASTNNLFGTLSSGVSWAAGKINSGLSFDGASRMSLGNPATLQVSTGTVTTWIKTNGGGSMALIHKDDAYQLSIINKKLSLIDQSTQTTCQSSADIADGSWHHIGMTFRSGVSNGTTLYIDGVVVKTCTMTIVSQTKNISIANSSTDSLGYTGMLDEIKMYNRVLDANDIKAEYTAGDLGAASGISLGQITPGQSKTASVDIITQTDAPGYNLQINQTAPLTSGSSTIPAIPSSVTAPDAWNEGSTKGLGFSLLSTNGPSLPSKWGNGNNYASFPNTMASFFNRLGYTAGTKDVLSVRLRADVSASQPAGDYKNTMVITGTITP